jgi:serine/threonine protein kinase
LEIKNYIGLKNLFSDDMDENAFDLLQKMLHFNPFKRISVDDALKHQFLKDIYEEENYFVEKYNFENIEKLFFQNNVDFKKLIYNEIFF